LGVSEISANQLNIPVGTYVAMINTDTNPADVYGGSWEYKYNSWGDKFVCESISTLNIDFASSSERTINLYSQRFISLKLTNTTPAFFVVIGGYQTQSSNFEKHFVYLKLNDLHNKVLFHIISSNNNVNLFFNLGFKINTYNNQIILLIYHKTDLNYFFSFNFLFADASGAFSNSGIGEMPLLNSNKAAANYGTNY
jgi:hypothetical protein